jgi:hypothetical protein
MVSSDGFATPLLPGGAGGTSGALTAGWTEPPITWPTVSTDTGWVDSHWMNELNSDVLTE